MAVDYSGVMPRVRISKELRYVRKDGGSSIYEIKGKPFFHPVAHDLIELAREHNGGDFSVGTEFSGKQIYRFFTGGDEDVREFYRVGLKDKVIELAETVYVVRMHDHSDSREKYTTLLRTTEMDEAIKCCKSRALEHQKIWHDRDIEWLKKKPRDVIRLYIGGIEFYVRRTNWA